MDLKHRPARPTAANEAQKKIFQVFWHFLNKYSEKKIQRGACLEFGCGRFGYINHYKEFFDKNYALDIYDFADCYKDSGVEFILSRDQLTIPLNNECIDVIVSHSVLEHVIDIEKTLGEIDRVLKIGGVALLTVSPLYYSSCGGHLYTKERVRLNNWEHIDPSSEYNLETMDGIQIDLGGTLNKLTLSRLLASVGKLPWDIEKYSIKSDVTKERPSFLDDINALDTDFHMKEFKMLVRKMYSFEGRGIRNTAKKKG